MPRLPGYIGVDVVPEAIEAARWNRSGRHFQVSDIRKDQLPTADLVICRDAMMHMPLADGLATLENFRRVFATWLVATTFDYGVNEDVPEGDFYHINLEAPPFSLGRPWMVIEDNWRHPDKLLGVWAIT
jgi:hypothetical protein